MFTLLNNLRSKLRFKKSYLTGFKKDSKKINIPYFLSCFKKTGVVVILFGKMILSKEGG